MHRREERDAAHVLVDAERVLQRGEGALLAVEVLAQAAGDADGYDGALVVEVDALGVDELARVLDLAAHADGLHGVRYVVAAAVAAHGAGDAEVHGAVRHARELGADHARRHERGVHVPPGACAAEAREADARAAEALGDVAGDVDAQEVEGHALGAGAAEGGEPVADLLEARAEAVREQLDVVALGARRLDERLVGHEQRRGEVVGERDAGKDARLRRRELLVAEDLVDALGLRDEPDLVGELEAPAARGEHLRQADDALLRVVAAHGLALVGDAHDPHLDAVHRREEPHEPR